MFQRNLSKFLVILMATVSFHKPALAVEKTESQSKAKITKTKKNSKKKKLGVDQSDFMPAANSYGFIVSYGASYNQLEQTDVKTVNHRISLAGTYSFDKHFSAYLSAGLSHQTNGSNIYRENDSDQFHNYTNTNLGVVYSKMKPLSFVNRSSNTLNISLPTSERSRFDRTNGSISLTNFMTSYSRNKFTLFNRITANYQWNTLRFSPTTDLVNRDWVFADSLGVNYMVLRGMGLRASFNTNAIRNLDDQWIVSYGNNFTVFGNVSGFQLFLSYLNQAYPENDRLDPVFFDQYRRLITGGVTYAF